jgi:hypothetical protein
MDLSSTKNIYTSCFLSVFLIILFVISPLSNFKVSYMIKFVIIILLSYTFYLSILQINKMKLTHSDSKSDEVIKQINMNIICNYIFTFLIGVVIIFIIKNLF